MSEEHPYEKSTSKLRLTANICGVDYDFGSVNLRTSASEIEQKMRTAMEKILDIEQEKRKTHVRTEAYRFYKQYTVPSSERAYRLGCFGYSVFELKQHLNFQSLFVVERDKAEWLDFHRFLQKFDSKPIIEKRIKQLNAGLPWLSSQYDRKKEAIIREVNEHGQMIQEAIPYVKEVLSLYNRRIRELRRQKAVQVQTKPVKKESPRQRLKGLGRIFHGGGEKT